MTVPVPTSAIDHAAACASTECAESDELKMRRFLRWMEENHATFPALAVKVENGRRHVYAKRPLAKHELALHVPRKLMITPEIARKTATGKLIAAHAEAHEFELADHDYLAVFILEIKREGGFWKPYVDVLPTDYSHIPLNYPEHELEALKGSYIYPVVLERRERHEAAYAFLSQVLTDGFTREAFTWATCVVTSRVYGVKIDDEKTKAMVPLAELFDHAQTCNLTWNPGASIGFVVAAHDAIDAGTELFESYGNMCNARMLNVYGCQVPDNVENVAEIVFKTLPADHPYGLRARKLGDYRYKKMAFRVTGRCDDERADLLFSYLRLACLDTIPQDQRPTFEPGAEKRVPPLDRDNEVAALTMLAQACRARLAEFPTTIEEDEALLKEGGLSVNMRNIVSVRRDEKKVLRYFAGLADTAIPVLRAEERYAAYFKKLVQNVC
jgi:hypothetical protein